MKTERRHELEKNTLADWLGHKIVWAEENARLIAGVVAGIVIIGIVYAVLSNRSQERDVSAWNSYFTASSTNDSKGLETLAKESPDLLAGQMADLRLADIALAEGLELISTDGKKGQDKINESKTYYSAVADRARDPWLKQRAALGLASGYEAVGLIDQAKAQYTKLKDWKDGLYNEAAAEKLSYLEKPETIKFAKWFTARERKPREEKGPLLDPQDLSKLPGHEGMSPSAFTPGSLSPSAAFPAGTAAATAAPAASASATAAPSATPTASPVATPAATPAASPIATPKATAAPSASARPSASASPTAPK